MLPFADYFITVVFEIDTEQIELFRASFLKRFDEQQAPLRNNTIATSNHDLFFRVRCQINRRRWEEFLGFSSDFSTVLTREEHYLLTELQIPGDAVTYKHYLGLLTDHASNSIIYYFAKDGTYHHCFCRLEAKHEAWLEAFCQEHGIQVVAPKIAA
ncbi:MAG: hypothetical protein KBB55_04345 [Candidatus Buchananbacteria bacterium]|nr:hypothetical protein [Candidatus Buchananbacteria bacterium]